MLQRESHLQDPLISIIVPVYNVERYLVKCLDSIVNQTYQNLQIILIEDGSSDNSGKISDDYSKKDQRISVIHKRNEGLSAARNEGVDIAEGEYIGFVDSDDYIEPDMYERLYKLIETTDAELAVCEFTYVNDEGIKQENESCFQVEGTIDANSYMKRWIDSKYAPAYVVAWNKLYKKKVFDGIRYPIGKYREDEYLIHHVIYQCQNIICTPDKLYNYVQHEGSVMKSKNAFLMDLGDALIDRYYLAKRESNSSLQKETIKLLSNELWEWKVFNNYDKSFNQKYLDYKKKVFRIIKQEFLGGRSKGIYTLREKIWIWMRVIVPKLSYSVYCLLKKMGK